MLPRTISAAYISRRPKSADLVVDKFPKGRAKPRRSESRRKSQAARAATAAHTTTLRIRNIRLNCGYLNKWLATTTNTLAVAICQAIATVVGLAFPSFEKSLDRRTA